MKDEFKNIEELFRGQLEDLESTVPDGAWNNISSSLNAAGTSGSIVKSALFKKIFIVSTLVVATSFATYYITENYVDHSEHSHPKDDTDISNLPESPEVKKTSTPIEKLTEENPDLKLVREITESNNEVLAETIEPKTDADNKLVTEEEVVADSNKTTDEYLKSYSSPTSWADQWITPTPKTKETVSVQDVNQSNDKKDDTPAESLEKMPTILANIQAAPVGGYAPLEVSFSHACKNGFTHWDFKDGSYSDLREITHTFENPGKYEVTLIVTGTDGKEVLDTKWIEVKAQSFIYPLPNILTPNGDGKNDILTVKCENIAEYNAVVFSATTGDKVFESIDQSRHWEGNLMTNEPAPKGNYMLYIKVVGTDGKIYENSSLVKLTR